MLKVFLSSSFRDLQDERDELIKKISPSLDVVCMESFIPDGMQSQEVAIENLRGSDVAVFLISPYYGMLIKSCLVSDCKDKDCPRGGISYTHCEYRFAVAENKPRMVYLIEPVTIKRELVKKYADSERRYNALKKEIQQVEMAPEVHEINTDQYDQITSGLAANIVKWYEEDRIQINDFYGRGRDLRELMEKIGRGNERVLVHGVGGIGKTTMIQVALLLQVMRGKHIFAIGPKQSYLSGSGYSYFHLSGAVTRQETQQPETISLYDLAEAFKVPGDILKTEKEKLAKHLLARLQERDRLTFIDDFHLADPDVKELVKQVASGIILASKEDTPLGRQSIELRGVTEGKRMDMVRGIASRLDKPVDDQTIGKIATLSEGHPVVMEILVNNYQDENFDNIQRALQSERLTGEEFLRRAVTSILSPGTLKTLQQIAIINPDLETNMDYHALWRTFPRQNIRELTRKSLLAKREGYSDRYRITFQSIQQTIGVGREKDRGYNEMAVSYYRNKQNQSGWMSSDDRVEILYHQLRYSFDPVMINRFLELCNELNPQDYGYRRLAAIGENLALSFVNESGRASVLGILGGLYSNLCIYGEAELAHLAALEIFQKLAAQDPGAYNSYLATTQNNLGALYCKTGRYRKAEQAILAALEIYEKLAAQNPEAYSKDLAGTQNNLGILYGITGRHREAERAFLAVLEIYEKLAAQDPGAYNSYLATTQNNLGALYSNTGRHGEAERAHLVALELRQKLAAQNPEAYSKDLAGTQNNLGNLYRDTGRHGDAERAHLVALELRQKLAAQNPGTYSRDLAGTQDSLGALYSKTGRHGDAERAILAALEIYEKLAAQNPGAYNNYLAMTQNNLGVLYNDTGRHGEAELAHLAALEIFQNLAAQNPGAYNSYLAITHNNLGNLYSNTGRHGEAERAHLAALEIRQNLAAQDPGAYNNYLAITHNNLGDLYRDIGRHGDAERACLAALEIYEKLAAQNPGVYSRNLAVVQSNLGLLYRDTGRHGEAELAHLAALEIFQNLAAQDPGAYNSYLAMTQNNLGDLYRDIGRHEEAERAYLAALEIYEELATKYPEAYSRYVQTVKNNLK
jgi:tetratricopeptide (TPR) repeat protein